LSRSTAPFAVIEELAGIGRHRLDGLMAAFRASQDGLKLHIGSWFRLAIHFAIRFYSGSRRIMKRGPFQSSIDPIADKEFSLLDCFGVVVANQGLEPYKAAVKTNGISSCHRSHPALKTQLAARVCIHLTQTELSKI
jgi:hypothetical protein